MAPISSAVLLTLLGAATWWSSRHAILPHKLTLNGALAGVLMAVFFPVEWGAAPGMTAASSALFGLLTGFLTTWALVELGKMAFGKVRHAFAAPVQWEVKQPDESLPPVLYFGHEVHPWENVFMRVSDRVRIDCLALEVSGCDFGRVAAVLGMETLTIQGAEGEHVFPLQDVTSLRGVTQSVEMPREVLGFGVVCLAGMTGSFVGPKLVLCMLGLCSVLLAAEFLLGAVFDPRARRCIEVAPFMLISAILCMVLRHYSLL